MFNANMNAIREVLDMVRPPRREPPTLSGNGKCRSLTGCLCSHNKEAAWAKVVRRAQGGGRREERGECNRQERNAVLAEWSGLWGVWAAEAEPKWKRGSMGRETPLLSEARLYLG